ncbi:MAG: hypothetical protein JNN06_12870 [Gemmobacter sp.]|uniref:calcium-binding protein n=1 Tax=Gemmobacter sp. TaxID=1898957 RepID=UPI001A556B27|nr:calcium-binding protein [Gemmobacter sp.]MBL8563161.1 hypothetical protein [Gemmobacter sp.]
MTDWSGYYRTADSRTHYTLEEPYEWLGLTYDSLIQMDLSHTLTGNARSEYNVDFVGKGITWADRQITGGAITGVLCYQPGQGIPRFGFHVSGLDLSARNLAAAIERGDAFPGSYWTRRMLNGDDTFLLSRQGDAVHAMGGNDLMEGRAGADTLWGDQDNDTLIGGAGADQLYADHTYYGLGDDRLLGLRGDDYLRSRVGQDSLYGGIGNDTLSASGHWAVLEGGAGVDEIELYGRHGTIQPGGGETTVFTAYAATFILGARHRHVEISGNDLDRSTFHITGGAESYDALQMTETATGVTIRWARATVELEGITVAQLSPDRFIFD